MNGMEMVRTGSTEGMLSASTACGGGSGAWLSNAARTVLLRGANGICSRCLQLGQAPFSPWRESWTSKLFLQLGHVTVSMVYHFFLVEGLSNPSRKRGCQLSFVVPRSIPVTSRSANRTASLCG